MIWALWVPYHDEILLFTTKKKALRYAKKNLGVVMRHWWKTTNPKIQDRWNATDLNGNQFILLKRKIR